VPFGYVVPDRKEKARLVPDRSVFWSDMTPAQIVAWMYELAGIERWSPARIAEHFNRLGVPTHYQKDGRQTVVPHRGKRKTNTDGLWRASRIRSLLLNTVYKGVYRYGKNPPKKEGVRPVREVIEGSCEALVPPDLWEAARQTMSTRMNWNPRNNKKHLLSSLVRSAACGLNYSGGNSHGKSWYRCNARSADNTAHRGECRCLSLDGSILEPLIKRDIAEFLLFPGDVLEDLAAEVNQEPERAVDEAERIIIQSKLDGMPARKNRAIKINLAEIITDEELAEQLADIEGEKRELERRLAEIPVKRGPKSDRPAVADDLLVQLREKVEEGFSEEQWRELVTLLVKRVVAHTEEFEGKPRLRVVVEYNFAPQTGLCGVSIDMDTREVQDSTKIVRVLQIPVRGRRS
jgi:site-specific DNA recombinase